MALRSKAVRSKNILRKRSLWAFSRHEVVRGVWKVVVVPGVTCGNEALCLFSQTRDFLEHRQHEAGRTALNAHRAVAMGAQGELGWSSFETREAVAKTEYERRV